MRGLTTFALLALTALSAAAVDQTQDPTAVGEAVVNEVVSRLIPGVFPFDYGFLRRLAVGGSEYGENPPTTEAPEVPPRQHQKFSPVEPLANPKIWPLTKDQFEVTQKSTEPEMVKLRALIQNSHLNLNWAADVTFEMDGAKPLHSAIATVLYAYSIQYGLGEELLPMILHDQVDFWAAHLHKEADADAKQAFIDAVIEAEAKDEEVCNRALDVVFLFDISYVPADFEASKEMVKNLVLKYNKDNAADVDTEVRFGLASYDKKGSTTPIQVRLPLTASHPEAALTTLISEIANQEPIASGEGDLGQGLKKAIEMHRASNQVPEVIVLITSGFKTDFQDPELQTAIDDAKSKGIRIIVLGLRFWDHADSEGLLELVPPQFFIKHFAASPVDVADLTTRAIHAGACQTDRAPVDLPASDTAKEVKFKAGEIKTWSTNFGVNTQEIVITIPEPGIGLFGWWCYDNTCSKPSEAVHQAPLLFGQDNKFLPATGISKVLFTVKATQEGTIRPTVKDIPKPPPTTTTEPPASSTNPTSDSTAPGPGSSPNPSEGPSTDGSGSPSTPSSGGTESTSTFSSSTNSADKVIVGPVLVLVSMLVLWFRV